MDLRQLETWRWRLKDQGSCGGVSGKRGRRYRSANEFEENAMRRTVSRHPQLIAKDTSNGGDACLKNEEVSYVSCSSETNGCSALNTMMKLVQRSPSGSA